MGAKTAAAIDRERLVHALERAPALAGRLAREAPFPSADAAVDRARAILATMNEAQRTAVLDAHPRIGADPRTLSQHSRTEQGPDREIGVLRELEALNEMYERRFGFRFVVFVAGRPKSEILPVMRERLERSREKELEAGIEEFLEIMRDRLSR